MKPLSWVLSISTSEKVTDLQLVSHSSERPGLACQHQLSVQAGFLFLSGPNRWDILIRSHSGFLAWESKSLLANDPSHIEGGGTPKRSFGKRQGQSQCGEQGSGVHVHPEGLRKG